MSEPEDPEVLAMRERAERVLAERAKKRAESPRDEEENAPKTKKKGRQWYHWVIDGALFLLLAYIIKTRFFDKPAEPPAPPAATAKASASAAPNVVTRGSAELRANPAPSEAVIDTLPPNTVIEVLELSPAGFMKVKTASGKTGWVPATAVATTP